MKRSRLKRSKGLRSSGVPKTPEKGAKSAQHAATARKRERKRARSERLHGPDGFGDFVRMRPCRKCGRVATRSRPNEMHHDPPEGHSRRGHWTMTSTLCTDCHTMGPGARHTMSHERFWSGIGTTREAANAETQAAWERFNTGLD